jgi:CBS domain-containing protein
MMRDKISEIMTNRVVTAGRSATVFDAAVRMSDRNIGSILVTEDSRVKGIITERDILMQLAKGSDLRKLPVDRLMTKDVITVASDTRIVDAAQIMVKHGFRRLPVVEHGILVGIVTATDLTFEMNSPRVRGTVADYMSRQVHTVPSQASVEEAISEMAKRRIGAVNVVDHGGVVGILSERDILRRVVAGGLNPSDSVVADVMTPEVIKVEPETQVSHACHLMYYYGHRRFPVVDKNDNLIGMVTERDLLKAMRPSYGRT